jgi:hypothetical protein
MVMSPATMLADDYWAFFRDTAQLWNIDRGDVDQVESWEDLSVDGVSRRVAALEEFGRRGDALLSDDVRDDDPTLLSTVAFGAGSNAGALPYQRDLTLVDGSMNATALLTARRRETARTRLDGSRGSLEWHGRSAARRPPRAPPQEPASHSSRRFKDPVLFPRPGSHSHPLVRPNFALRHDTSHRVRWSRDARRTRLYGAS